MPRSRRDIGDAAEDRAAEYLRQLGYTIVTRNFQMRGGEIDLVAMDGEEVVFVEVKYRSRSHPEEAFGATKGARLRRAASAYLRAVGAETKPYRFDLVAVEDDHVRHHARVQIGE